jgi:hypothetical protein
MKVSLIAIGAVAAACATGMALADDASGSLATGYGYSSGKYGTTTSTTIQSVPITGSLNVGDFSFDVSVPYLNVSGDPNVIPGVGKVNNTNPKKRGNGKATGTGSGLGDAVLSASYDLITNEAAHFGLDVEGGVKLATGDKAQGLGTGATDYTVGLGAFKEIDALTLTAGVDYTAVGNSNFIKLKKNVFGYSAGAAYKLDEDWLVGASFESGAQSGPIRKKLVARGISGTETRDVTGYFSYTLAPDWKLGGYALAGLSTSSPDFGAGATITLSF